MTNPPLPAAQLGANPRHDRRLLTHPYVLLTLTMLFWGGNAVAGKAAIGHVDAYALMVLRWGGAFLVVLPFAMRPLRRDWPLIRQHWWLYVFYGAVGFASFNVLLYLAARYTSGINNALDQVTINILVMLGNFVLFRTRVRGLQLAGVALTVLGVAFTASHGNLARLAALDINLGDALVLLGTIAYAAYSIALRYRPNTHWLSFIAVTFAICAATSLLFQTVLGGGLAIFLAAIPAISPLGWLIVAYTVLFPSIVSQLLYVRGVEMIGANRASLFINLIPFFGALGSVLILGERLEPFHLAAGLLIVMGIVLAEWSARRA